MDPWYDSSINFFLWICKLNQSQLNLQICLHYDIVAIYGKRGGHWNAKKVTLRSALQMNLYLYLLAPSLIHSL
jgi:hypothetical protein